VFSLYNYNNFLQDAAEALLHTLVNVCGRYPPESGPHTFSSELTESDILTVVKNNYCKLQQVQYLSVRVEKQ
jgi:hypothetical protein